MITTNKTLILVFGPPGSGKSTACHLLSENNADIKYISTGTLSRQEKDNNTEIGKVIKQLELQHKNFPPKLLGDIVISKIYNSPEKVLILDSYPKNNAELEYIINIIKSDFKICIIIFEIKDQDELKSRMHNRRRQGESLDIQKNRLNYYEDNIKPLVDHPYLINYDRYVVDATKGVKQVYMQVAQMVEQLAVNQ